MTFQFFFFYPPRPIIYLLLLKDLFLTGLRFRNRNSQRGQPTLLAICSWHFLLASLHSLGQMFSIFCGLLIFLYCLFRAVLQDAWSDVMLSLGWSGPLFPTFFKGFLTTHWHTSFQRDQKVFRLCLLFWTTAAEAQYLLYRNILLSLFYSSQAESPQTVSTMHLKQTCALSPKSSLICSRDATCSIAGTCYCGARHLESWENSVIPTDLDHKTLPEHLRPCAPHIKKKKKKQVCHPLQQVSFNGWEGDSQLLLTQLAKRCHQKKPLSSNAQRVMHHFTIIFKIQNDIFYKKSTTFWVKTYRYFFLTPDSNHNSSKSICLKMLLCDCDLKEKAF